MMTRGKAAAVLLLLCLARADAVVSRGAAQQPAAKQGINLRTKGRGAVVVREGGRSHVLDVSQHIEAARIEDASQLFLTRKGGFVHLVLQVCGPSKAKPNCASFVTRMDGLRKAGSAG